MTIINITIINNNIKIIINIMSLLYYSFSKKTQVRPLPILMKLHFFLILKGTKYWRYIDLCVRTSHYANTYTHHGQDIIIGANSFKLEGNEMHYSDIPNGSLPGCFCVVNDVNTREQSRIFIIITVWEIIITFFFYSVHFILWEFRLNECVEC